MPLATKKYIEEEIVRNISLGDKKAFKELYQLYYNRLCQFALLFFHSKELSEEVVSDVFLNVWIKRDRLVPERNIRSFLYTSVRHRAIDLLRTNSIHPKNNINVYELELESPEPSVDDTIDREQFRERLQKAFDKLPEQCRIAARMHFNDQLSYKEIAVILGISYKTVKAQIAIATKKVKETFKKNGWDK